MQPCVYILASKRNGTLYVGVTSDLLAGTWQHKNSAVEGFTRKYDVYYLIWYELHESMDSAIAREKAIKKFSRTWKLKLVEKLNPEWKDLYNDIF